MSEDGRIPVFVERKTYRRRRMADAARMLPMLGAMLFCLPLLWAIDEEPRTALTMFYLFLVWVGLCVVSAVISAHLPTEADNSQTEDQTEGP
ncbi:hypothetical protein [Roseovarius sp. MMSF_3281]|uniref:hypothetical protein n=1 Tax=Roseovarius sp. MMSF_3281 TaxID=3046694 RepID=UPI00273ED8E6|nr:hypothetical protein [Roseovarius sp. MMSF_3281]